MYKIVAETKSNADVLAVRRIACDYNCTYKESEYPDDRGNKGLTSMLIKTWSATLIIIRLIVRLGLKAGVQQIP